LININICFSDGQEAVTQRKFTSHSKLSFTPIWYWKYYDYKFEII